MNSNRKNKLERTRTPVHLNSSEYVSRNSATKRFSPNLSRRPNLNETVAFRPGPSNDPKFKTKLCTNNEVNYEIECDMVYNEYLQAQMKRQLVIRKVKEHKDILEDQLLIQNEILHRRQQNLNEIVVETESFRTKSQVVDMIDNLEKNFINFMNVCGKYNMEVELVHFKEALALECDKIVLRNIKPLENQKEYDNLISTLEFCLGATQKIINSGRDFKEVHNLAESIRVLSNFIQSVQQTQQTVSELEQNALYTFLQNMSDFFARMYNEQ